MTDNVILEGLQEFLKKNVAPKIKLQKPSVKDITAYELVNPAVHIGWIPPKFPEKLNPEEQVPDIPCLIVGMEEGEDDGKDAGLSIRISFVTYNPGTYQDGKFIPSFDGYKDLVNLIVLTRRELVKASVIGGVTTVERPFRWGMYQDQPHPYWYGWLTFNASCSTMVCLDID